MESLIPIINRLQDAFSLVEGGSPIDLPQIVVIGSQSSGKSSVLENLVGKDFLPRGSGIVTRRPLILQLIHVSPKDAEKNPGKNEYGEFLHIPGQKFYDFTEIREEIKRETDRVTGSNKGVSHSPINLKVHSPHVLNLTLVDLPGITKVPIGDQPKDIEAQIRNMIMKYIEKPAAIILAVTAANTDLTNSDALQLARVVDPECKRTIGVITKLDLMDKGTDALDMLMGRVVPLRLGFVGVVNRSQKDINENRPIQDALGAEKQFFETHALYKPIASKSGTQFLGQKCASILMNHIRNSLPDLKQKLNQMVQITSEELASYGDNSYGMNQGALLLQVISHFSTSYTQMIEGKVSDDHSVESLYGGARINYIFNEIFSRYLSDLNPLEGLTSFDIRTAMSNATGPKSALFVPESAFELLVRRQLVRIQEPAIQCVDLVYDELDRIIANINSPELARFHALREDIIEASLNFIRSCRSPTKEMIQNLLNMELNFVNTNHPHFRVDAIIGNVMAKKNQQNQPPQLQQPPVVEQKPPLPAKTAPVATKAAPLPAKPAQTNMFPDSPPKDEKSGFFGMFFSGQQQPSYNSNNSYQQQSKQVNAQPQVSNNYMNNYNQPQQQQQAPSRSNSMSQSNYQHHSVGNRLQQPPSSLNVSTVEGKEFEIKLLEGLLESYFDIVRTNIVDYVPKAVMFFLVNKSKTGMQNELVQALYKDQNFERLFEESPDIVSKRNAARNMLTVLTKAQSILSEIRDFKL
eukprot:TRINITY_DN10770_c0_g1_i1.p1 TRINITY_DN10770_c0_g1~~TRINITY_DN10770_c0_g1_i1.p1  ORF type:complete len:749 (+),score=252.76 TRINITY_DN10770_c0_g1_i1:179-2425(+)